MTEKVGPAVGDPFYAGPPESRLGYLRDHRGGCEPPVRRQVTEEYMTTTATRPTMLQVVRDSSPDLHGQRHCRAATALAMDSQSS